MFSEMALIVRRIGLLGSKMRAIQDEKGFDSETVQEVNRLLDVAKRALDSVNDLINESASEMRP